MERKWNANGTHFRTLSGRVPNAFSVRLFLNSTVNAGCFQLRDNYFCTLNIKRSGALQNSISLENTCCSVSNHQKIGSLGRKKIFNNFCHSFGSFE